MTDLIRVMTADEARRLTERIRLTAATFAESKAKLMDLVEEAKTGGAHFALGYESWTAYLSDVLSDEPLRLARDERREVVSILAAEGMSTRAIAPIVGTSQKTVVTDLQSEVIPQVSPAPRAITGRDGKTYTPKPPANVDVATGEITEPRATPRKPLTDQFFDAAYDLSKVTERIERLAADDRFPQNAEKVATKHRSDLIRAVDALQGVLNRLPSA